MPRRSTTLDVYRGSNSKKRELKLRRPPEFVAAGLDLAARLRVFRQAIRTRIERREAFPDIVRAVNSSLEPVRIAELTIDRAAAWIPAPGWALVSGDLAGDVAVLAERGLDPELLPTVSAAAQWVMQQGEPFTSADIASDSRLSQSLPGTVLAFPLSSRGRRTGALVAMDPAASSAEPRLSPGLLRSVRTLLEPVGIALDNALLLKRTEALSVTDDLTHLYNSRYLNLVLRRETKRATRSGRPLSLLFLDLDGFKAINDRYGHLCGSRALVEAADVIRGSARETDVVARFGGDEFALVLPDTGADGARAVGERIRERIAAHLFLATDGLDFRLTVSIGVATLPDAAGTAEELVKAADTAMYRVKDHGKNGIHVAGSPADN